jgi:anti-sigma regulatory factor (Ser/Thr protein kinase)
MSIDVADNGEIAVRMVNEKGYDDAVLMDMQMPVMDGVSATRAIRSNPRFDDRFFDECHAGLKRVNGVEGSPENEKGDRRLNEQNQRRSSRSQMSFHLKLVMPSDPRFLSIVRAAVGELGLVYGLPDESCRGVILAVDEALANVIRHAYKNRYDQEIELNCRIGADQMEFTILDQGESPDPARICVQPLNDESLSGRGTHLIKAIMNSRIAQSAQ